VVPALNRSIHAALSDPVHHPKIFQILPHFDRIFVPVFCADRNASREARPRFAARHEVAGLPRLKNRSAIADFCAIGPREVRNSRTGGKEMAVIRQQVEALAVAPHWNPGRRELRYGEELIKRFRGSARNQELVLAVFQELGWPECIDDPLPPQDEIDSKQRLQTTIKSLNRNRRAKLIGFHGNGTGTQIYWEAVETHSLGGTRRQPAKQRR
jgi:hypothetical protein